MPGGEAPERADGDDAPVGRAGGRRLSRLSAGVAAPAAGLFAPGPRWSLARRQAVVLRLIAGEPAELVSREIGVPLCKPERWCERAEVALDAASQEREAGGAGPGVPGRG